MLHITHTRPTPPHRPPHHGRPLCIGIVTDDFYPNSGGVARSIELQTQELAARGHRVILIAPKPFFIPPTHCEYIALDAWHIRGTPSYLCSVKFDKSLAEKLSRAYPFDIIHSQNERGSMFLAARIARQLSIPHVHTFHSNYAGTHRTAPWSSALNTYTYMKLAPLMMRRIRNDKLAVSVRLPRKLSSVEDSRLAKHDWKAVARLARFVDAFTSPAPYVIDNINDATRYEITARGFVVPNGVNRVFARAERIRNTDDTIRFLSCGRLDPEKRVDVIIRAFAKLPAGNCELYILGTGSEDAQLRHLARELAPRGRIEFLGHYEDHERVANEFANSDVFVFASYRFDTQGMVLGEAASAGAAIIYCDNRLTVGVNEHNAILTHPSVTAFETAMRRVIDDRELLHRMQHASKRLAPTLTASEMCTAFLRVYRSTLHPKARPFTDEKITSL